MRSIRPFRMHGPSAVSYWQDRSDRKFVNCATGCRILT